MNNFAISSGGIGQALQRSASSMAVANNSLDETIALITAANTVSQNPEKVGNAFKTISMRLRAAKTELSEMGEDTEGMAESTASLRAEMLALTGVDLMENNNQFKSTYKFLEELSVKWKDLTDIQKASVIELSAGKHQGNVFASLMENFDIAQNALQTSLNSSGSAMKEHEKWSESLEAKLLKLKASWQSFAQTFMNSDLLKGGVDALAGLVDILEKLIDNFGLLGTAGLGVIGKGAFEYFKYIKSGAADAVKAVSDVVDAVSDVADVADTVTDGVSAVANTADAISDVADVASNATGAMGDLGGAVKKTNGGFKAFMKTPMGVATAIGAVVAVIGLAISAYKNYKEELSQARQETIRASDEFLDASNSFELAYIKYSGKTNLTAEEESELEAAINGTVEALGDKSSALQKTVDSSNDYVASLEAITRAELKASAEAAESKKVAAEKELEDTAIGWIGESLVDQPIMADDLQLIKDNVGDKYLEKRGSRFAPYWYTTLPSNADADDIVEYYNYLLDIQKLLEKEGRTDTTSYDQITKAIDKMSESIETYTNGVYDAVKAQYQLANGIPKTTEEYLKMRESILFSDDIKDLSFDTKKTIAGTLDSEYGQSFDLTTAHVQSRKLIGVIDKYSDTEASQMEMFLNMRTSVNNGECTVGEYISQFGDIEKLTKDWTNKEKEEFNLTFGIDNDNIKTQYDETQKYLGRFIRKRNDGESTFDYVNFYANENNKIKEFLNGLSASELSAVYSLKAELDWENGDFNEILAQIQEEAARQEAITFTIDIVVEKEKLDGLQTAISEAVSGTGLSTESISVVEDVFGKLDSYDPSKLFERTANGIRLNTDEYRRLNDEYSKTNITGLNKKMSALGDEYNQTREELYALTYGTEEYTKKSKELTDIEDQIKALETLGAQYEGLASKYNQWQMAESAGSQRDMYETIIGGWETVGDEISRGWYDEGTIQFLELLTGRTDLAGMSAKELKKVYKDLDNTIEGTSHSVRDFFTVDEDGNSTSKGVYNFLEAVEDVTGKVDVVKRDEKGNIVGFDFQLYGGDEAIAEALGVSEELVQIMKRAADDAGFVVSLDGTYQQLDVLKEKAQTAAESLNKTLEKSGKKGFNFNFNATEVEDIKKQLAEAGKILEGFRNKDGSINMELDGAEEALTVASTLQSMLDKLTRPTYMNIEVSQVGKEIQDPLKRLQELRTLTETEHQLKLSGADTSELDKSKKEIYDYFENLDPDIKAEIGLVDDKGNPLTGDALKKKLESGDLMIEATVDIQMEMDEKLGILVDKALLEAGIITEEEFEKRVKVYLKADEVDDSDVEKKTEETGNEKSVVEKPVEIITTSYGVDTSKTEEEIEKAKEKIRKKISENVGTPYSKETIDVAVNFLADTDAIDNYTPKQLNAIVEFIANTDDIESYTPEQKEALVTFFAETNEPDSYTPEEKKAIVDYLAGTKSIDEYSPEDQEAIVNFINNSSEPDKYQPDPKTGMVTFNKDSSIPDGYNAPNPTGTVTFEKNSVEVDGYDPPDFVRTVTYKIKEIVSKVASGGKKKAAQRTGSDLSPVNGTANVNGSTGRAFKQGSWGTKGSGTALVGELGREVLVRNGRYYTIGDNGAEFIKYKQGDIIFNHIQSEELFKNGKVTSGGGRARSFANGTAFSSGYDGKDSKPVGTDEKDKFEEVLDFIEIAISRLERTIDNFDKTANNIYKSWNIRNNALTDEISKIGEEILLQSNAASKYKNKADSINLSEDFKERVRNGSFDISTVTNEDTAEKIKDYQKWYELYLKCIDAAEDLRQTEYELYQQRFDNITSRYDGILQGYEHTESMLNEYVSQAEANGHIVSKKYYQALIDNEEQNIADLQNKQVALINARDEAVDGGKITKYSQAWYDMCSEIDSVTQAIEEGNTALIEYDNSIRDIDWQVFDIIQERISNVTKEAEFLIELMSNDKLFDDNGKLTDKGMATMGLHGQNYNTYMYQANDYKSQIKDIDDKITLGELDGADEAVINRRQELLELQRESILSAEQEKQAIRDLVEDGINLELDALQERIDKHNEEIESIKDLYDYQKQVKEQSEEIASLEKQRAAYLGDNSDESRAKLQEITVSLKEAKDNLEETEYERYISDQQKLLDSLYEEYELVLNQRLDDTNTLITESITAINENANTIKGAIETSTGAVGASLSTELSAIWNTGSDNVKSVLTMYGEDAKGKSTTTNTVLNGIKNGVDSLVNKSNTEAKEKVEANKTSSSSKKDPTKPKTPTTSKNNNNKKPTSGGDGTPKKGDKVKFISGQYYYDSQGKRPLGNHMLGKDVYITNINKKSWATHPYHISTGKKLGKGDLGWLKLSQISGYATGKHNFLNNEIAWTQENGKEFIVRPSDGAILTPIAKGDSVLTSAASNNIWDMANSPTDFIKENLNLGTADVPNNSSVQNSYTQYLDKVVFNLPNVKNYEELLHAMQEDKKFERLILSMTMDRIAGKSNLTKGKSIR